jgi:carboxypeptidase family protein
MTFTALFSAAAFVWGKSLSNTASKALRVLTVIVAVSLMSVPLLSQSSQGTIQGAIFDQTRGAIPGATVTVTDVARGVTRTLTTDSVGAYVATNLTPGTYTVRGEAKGFQNIERTGVLVEVGQNIRVDLTLQPGAQTQTVTVTGEVPEIDTTDSTLGGTLSNSQIVALPLNGRNFLHLLDLRPGIYFFVGGSAPAGASTSTNGSRFGTDLLTVEGVPSFANTGGALGLNAMYHVGDSQSLVPIDSIQEFNTEQNAKAEYGWRAGSVINMGIKSGTNAFHGSAYAFGRDASATDAGNYFSTPGQPVVTPATVKQFGATAGGPILKDKLFFFVAYEGLRTTLTNPVVDTIPASASVGDPRLSFVDACNVLNPTHLANSDPANPISALSAQLAGLNTATCTVSPASSTFENLFPFSATGLFQPSLVTLGPLDNGLIKGDYAVSQHHHVSGFFYRSQAYQVGNSDNGQISPRWEGNIPSTVEMFTGSWTWTPNSNWVNDVRAGLDYLSARDLTADRNMFTQPAWPAGYGFNSGVTQAASPLYGGLPQIIINSVTGFLGSGRTGSVRGPDGEASFIDNVSYLRGKHSFKFGFQFMDLIYDNNSYRYNSGQVKFNNVQDFLSGNVHKWQLQIGNADVNMRAHWFSGFFQDDYRLSTRVTLNLGLRWEYQGPPVERGNYESTFNPNLAWPVQQVGGKGMPAMYKPYYKAFSPRVGVAWDVRGNGRTVVRAAASVLRDPQLIGDYVGFSPFGANVPDVGINTSGTPLNDHTPETLAVSGSGGINWTGSTLEPNATQSVFPVGQPITVQTPNGTIVSGLTGTTCLSPNDNVLSGVKPPACTTQAVNPKFVQPYLVAWNLDVQRAITNNLTVDVAYVGTHAGNQDNFIDVNQPPIGAGYNTPFTAAQASAAFPKDPTTAAAAVGLSSNQFCLAGGPCGISNPGAEVGSGVVCTACPYGTKYPFLTNISQMVNNAYSNYNALQMTVGERASHGLAFLASYTYSHSLDIGSSHGGAPQIDSFNPRLNYGTSDFDITHHFSFAPDYNIPGIKSPGQMLQGWTVSGILSLSSGQPWFPNDLTNDILGTNEINGLGLGVQTWNYSGTRSAFTAGPTPIPCYVNGDNGNSPLGGCVNYSTNPTLTTPQATQAWSSCVSAATAAYPGNTQLQGLALASLNNIGCYITTKGGILLPPAYGTVGNASRNIFRAPGYFNVDFSIAKDWKFKERFGAQFRVEFFNVFNHANFQTPGSTGSPVDLGSGTGGLFGCACATPDVAGGDPVLGGGGPRHIQFGLKLNW